MQGGRAFRPVNSSWLELSGRADDQAECSDRSPNSICMQSPAFYFYITYNITFCVKPGTAL